MNVFQRAYELGCKEAADAFKPVAPPKPSAPTSHKLPTNPVGARPAKPAATPQLDIPKPQVMGLGMPPPAPAMPQIAMNTKQLSSQNAFNSQMKMLDPLAKFNSEIEADNGPYHNQPNTNEDGNHTRQVSQGFNHLTTPQNTDYLNETSDGNDL